MNDSIWSESINIKWALIYKEWGFFNLTGSIVEKMPLPPHGSRLQFIREFASRMWLCGLEHPRLTSLLDYEKKM